MTHQPLALKYRPAAFADVIGQAHVTRTLQNALNQNRIAPAYLFAGPRGSGKTTTARLLARALNCDEGVSGEPCGRCANCTAIAAGRSLDVIEIDAASNRGIDDIKELRETVKYAPAQGRSKVYIVDEVHQLSKDAFNAFLKTLEEPPRGVVFVLATTEPHKILATILSRCQRFDFRPIPLAAIRERLAMIAEREGIVLDEPAAFAIAKKADGSLRDALSLLDQVVAFGGETIDLDALRRLIGLPDEERYLELTRLLAAGDPAGALRFAQEVRAAGYDLEAFYVGLLEHLRDCLLFALDGAAHAAVPERYHDAYREAAAALGADDLLRMLTLATDEEQVFRRSGQQALVLEVLLVRLALLDRTVDLDRLLGALGTGGAGASPGGSAAAAPAGATGAARGAARKAPPGRKAPPAQGTSAPDGVSSGSPVGPPTEQQPAAPREALTLDGLLAAWDDVLEAVHGRRPVVAAALKGTLPTACSETRVELALPPDAEYRREQLTQRGELEPLATVLAERWRFAGRIHVMAAAAGSNPAGPPAQPPAAAPTARELEARDLEAQVREDPLLQHAMELFDANVVRVGRSLPA